MLVVEAVAWSGGLPYFTSRHTRPYFNGNVGDVEEKIEPDHKVDQIIRCAFAAGHEDSEIQKQDGQLGCKYDRVVYNFDNAG